MTTCVTNSQEKVTNGDFFYIKLGITGSENLTDIHPTSHRLTGV